MSDANEFVKTYYGKVRYELKTDVADKRLYIDDDKIRFSDTYSSGSEEYDDGNKVHQIARKAFERNLANCIANTFDQMLQLKLILESAGISDFTEIMEAETARFFASCYDGKAQRRIEDAGELEDAGDER